MHLVRLCSLVVLIVGCLLSPLAQASSTYADMHPFDLLQRSLKTPSASERAILRRYLADHHTQSAEGLFSAAWLAGINGESAKRNDLYRQAIEENPELTVAYINLAQALEREGKFDEARQLYDDALASAPLDGDVIRNSYFLRKNQDKNPADAERFLKHWEQEIGSQEYVFDFVRALDAEQDGRLDDAAEFYRLTIEKEPPFEAYKRATQLQLQLLEDQELGPSVRFAMVSSILLPLQEVGEAQAFQFAGELLRDDFNSPRLALGQFRQAFEQDPTAELAETIFQLTAVREPEEGQSFLASAVKSLPDNYAYELTLAWLNYNFLTDLDASLAHSLKALELAPHDAAKVDAATSYGLVLERYGRFDEAFAFYKKQQQQPFTEGFQRQLMRRTVENRIGAQDFAEAAAFLEKLAVTPENNSVWFATNKELVDRALDLKTPTPSDLDEQPFDRGFNDTASIRFAFNSAEIPLRARAALAELAEELTANADIVLSIEGHTDITGNGPFNFDLSLDRARAVQSYLQTQHQIDADRLRVSGLGPAFPDVSNRNRSGRAQNRRVDMRLIPANAQPADFAGMDDGAFSSDGRLSVLGQNPPQLVDLRGNTKLGEFYRGRTHRFSSDNAFVSSISQYTEENGQTTNVLYIYDTASGRPVAQLHEPVTVSEAAWRPDGKAIAYSTDDGFLKLYDLHQNKFLAVTRMGTVRIGGPLSWLPDGSAIVGGQHRMTSLNVWDGETLAHLRSLEGVNWPHAIGVSPDGRHVLAFDNQMQMSVWNTRNWRGPQQAKTPMIPQQLAFHPTRPWVVLNAKFDASETALAVMDYRAMSLLGQWENKGTFQIGLMPGGETLVAGQGNRIEAFRTPSLRPLGEVTADTQSRTSQMGQ